MVLQPKQQLPCTRRIYWSPLRRRHWPGSVSDWAGWWCGGGRSSESLAGGGCHWPAGRGWHGRAGHGPVPAASGPARSSRLVLDCQSLRSIVPYGTRPAVKLGY